MPVIRLLENKEKREFSLSLSLNTLFVQSMHIKHYQNWERNNSGRNVLGGNGIGGEITRVWGAKLPRVKKKDAKRLGGKQLGGGGRLGGEMTCYP